jgi:hypothetical protein
LEEIEASVKSYSWIHRAAAQSRARAAFALGAALVMVGCSDGVAPRQGNGPTVRITPIAGVFEGDVIRLTAEVIDATGAEDPNAVVTWTVSDTTLAKVASPGRFALLRAGTVRVTARSGPAAGIYDLAIGRLVVTRVELTPGDMSLGRGDRVQVQARVVGQGDRAISGRVITFTSDDAQVATIGSPQNTVGAPGFLIAVGPGSTTIRASVDGVTGTARVGVVIADTTFVLTHFNGGPLPVLVAADTVMFDGVKEFDEVYADSGTFVLSGLAQERYNLNVRFSQYQVIRTGDTVQRELRLRFLGEIDRGVVTVGADGNLSMLSELIGPRLEHTASRQPDGYLVHFHEPGDDFFLDLRYRRVTP